MMTLAAEVRAAAPSEMGVAFWAGAAGAGTADSPFVAEETFVAGAAGAAGAASVLGARTPSAVTAVINSIAFQTNILALNAAVEAARAGEQGRGFAVVASEVRNLSQRSSQAAKEIATLIGESVSRIDAGSALVAKAGDTMKQIVASVTRVNDIMGEISSASEEQSLGIAQIALAISELDTTTQQNAALVTESSIAASSLEDQSTVLENLVAHFIL